MTDEIKNIAASVRQRIPIGINASSPAIHQ
jgi:hypothetical protein